MKNLFSLFCLVVSLSFVHAAEFEMDEDVLDQDGIEAIELGDDCKFDYFCPQNVVIPEPTCKATDPKLGDFSARGQNTCKAKMALKRKICGEGYLPSVFRISCDR